MGEWLRARWSAYVASYDAEVVAAASAPNETLLVVLPIVGSFACFAYLPYFEQFGGFSHSTLGMSLAVLGGVSTCVSWKHRCRGPIGQVAALLDNVFYSAALAVAAVYMEGPIGLALAVVYSLVVVLFPARYYGLSLVFGVAMSLPLLVLFVVGPVAPTAMLILVGGLVLLLVASGNTANRRLLLAREAQLKKALDAADRVADESHQAALTTTLLSLGHFLHELRNYQTAIGGNLSYLSTTATLDSASAEALEDAVEVQQLQEQLVRDTITELSGRAKAADTSFHLGEVLGESMSTFKELSCELDMGGAEFEVQGNPEYLRIVLLNVIRNALQAGAQSTRIVVGLEPSGHSVLVRVADDGSGIPEPQRSGLFESFADSSKPAGSGLGLYLVRRYMELLGGAARLADSRVGTCIVLQLPVGVMSAGAGA